MTNLSKAEKEHKIHADELAEQYRREGYNVIVEPGPTDLPFELGRYRPDLLVRKEQGGFLVEVKTRADRLSVDQLSSVADEVKKHPGWRFLLVTGQDVASEGLPGKEDEAASWDDISNRIHHAQRLEQTGDNEAAFLILWIALEQLLRIHARQAAIPVERLSPSIMIRQLYSLGELSFQQFDVALECQRTRNRLVHGFPAGDLVSSTYQLAALVSELLAEWSASKTPG